MKNTSPPYSRHPIIAIDGPAGAGKSTIASKVANTLGLLYLDTGAMYRAITWLVIQSGYSSEDTTSITQLVRQSQIEIIPKTPTQEIKINGHDVTQAIRTPEVTAQVPIIAAQPAVRTELVKQQQQYGKSGGIVAEGRDIGTHVFPDAELKIFLTASVTERAYRRQQDLKTRGLPVPSLEELEHTIHQRDLKDYNRENSPLRQAEDAIELKTDHLSIEQVQTRIIELYQLLNYE